jgi:ABC-type glycerol-3-phosphate transport system substrate-binding protein
MKKTARFLAACLVAGLAFPIFAGGGSQQQAQDVSSGGKLVYWLDNSVEEFKGVYAITEDWNKSNPGIQVELVPLPTQDAYNQKLMTAAAGNALPDILHVDELFVPQFADAGILADITALANGSNPMNKADLNDSAIAMATYNGKLYGYPDNYTWCVLAYRKDNFIAAGLDPNKPPKTWDEFVTYAKKLTDASKNQYGFVIQPYDWWFISWLWMNGGDLFSPDGKKCVLDSPEAVEALQFYCDLNDKHHVVPPAALSAMRTAGTQFSAESAFINGQIAMLQIGPWLNMNYYSQRPDDVDNLMYAEFPVNGNKKLSKQTIGGRVTAITATSTRKDDAWIYIKTMTENKLKWFENLAKTMDAPTALRDINWGDTLVRKSPRNWELFRNPHMKIFIDSVGAATLRPRALRWIEKARFLNEELQAAILGLKTPKKAMEDATARINAVM